MPKELFYTLVKSWVMISLHRWPEELNLCVHDCSRDTVAYSVSNTLTDCATQGGSVRQQDTNMSPLEDTHPGYFYSTGEDATYSLSPVLWGMLTLVMWAKPLYYTVDDKECILKFEEQWRAFTLKKSHLLICYNQKPIFTWIYTSKSTFFPN